MGTNKNTGGMLDPGVEGVTSTENVASAKDAARAPYDSGPIFEDQVTQPRLRDRRPTTKAQAEMQRGAEVVAEKPNNANQQVPATPPRYASLDEARLAKTSENIREKQAQDFNINEADRKRTVHVEGSDSAATVHIPVDAITQPPSGVDDTNEFAVARRLDEIASLEKASPEALTQAVASMSSDPRVNVVGAPPTGERERAQHGDGKDHPLATVRQP